MGCCLGFLRSGSRWNGTPSIKALIAYQSVTHAVCTVYAVCFPCYYFSSSWNFS